MIMLELTEELEPTTCRLQGGCTTYCATSAYSRRDFVYGIEPFYLFGIEIVYLKLSQYRLLNRLIGLGEESRTPDLTVISRVL